MNYSTQKINEEKTSLLEGECWGCTEMNYLRQRLQMQQEPNKKYCIQCGSSFPSYSNLLVASMCNKCLEYKNEEMKNKSIYGKKI